MAIVGIGTDIVALERIQKLYDKHPQRFAERILTSLELEEIQSITKPVNFLAKRFAVKEAASKALGTGIAHGVQFADFEVQHDELGRPSLISYNRAAEIMQEKNITLTHLSISDEKRYAVAYVIFES